MLSNEIERLNNVLKSKVEESNGYENKNRTLVQENEGIKREMKSIEQKISVEYQTRITTYETKIRQFTQDNEDLKRRVQEMGDMSRKLIEYENRMGPMAQEI